MKHSKCELIVKDVKVSPCVFNPAFRLTGWALKLPLFISLTFNFVLDVLPYFSHYNLF